MNNRFYEGLCDPFAYEPTKDCLSVLQTEEQGEGLVALRSFSPGDVVFRFYGPMRDEQTLFTLQKEPGVFVEDPLVMGKVLHSCAPNMECDMATQTFTASKPIASGDFLTMDYETTEDELFRPFVCQCGAPQCRGEIKGRIYRVESRAAVAE